MFAIDRESDSPLYIQIRDSILEAIDTGKLHPGDRLPPVTNLAKDIGVTQATIRRALQDLSSAGHTECHVGRGTFIKDAGAVNTSTPPEALPQENFDGSPVIQPNAPTPFEFAARRLRSGVSKALYDIMPLVHKPGIIQLTKGIPDPDLIPDNFIEELTQDTLQNGAKQYIQATEPAGMYALREEIAAKFNQSGNHITPEHVLITNGSIQGLALIAEAALEDKPKIICETPCFQGIPDTFTAMGHWVETVRRDEHGPITAGLDRFTGKTPAMLYLCPYAHNPTGTHLSNERSAELVEWAQRSGSVLIADEVFKDLGYSGEPQPSLLDQLGSEQTIVVSSLSKSVMTGLRLGWLISSPQRIQQLSRLKRLMDHACPSLIQGIALTLFRSGKFDAHTKKMQETYRERMDIMLQSLQKRMPKEITWSIPMGGFSILVKLPKGYSSVALLLSAINKGVSFLPGPLFDIDQRYVNALRLSCAWANEHQIKEGVELLACTIEDFIRQPPGDSGLSGLGHFQ